MDTYIPARSSTLSSVMIVMNGFITNVLGVLVLLDTFASIAELTVVPLTMYDLWALEKCAYGFYYQKLLEDIFESDEPISMILQAPSPKLLTIPRYLSEDDSSDLELEPEMNLDYEFPPHISSCPVPPTSHEASIAPISPWSPISPVSCTALSSTATSSFLSQHSPSSTPSLAFPESESLSVSASAQRVSEAPQESSLHSSTATVGQRVWLDESKHTNNLDSTVS